jgi:hypothetical protein
MTECDEVAASILAAHQGEAIQTYADAERVARLYLADETATVVANVAETLWRLSR